MKTKTAVALPDVNVLIALFDPAHPFHDPAHRWFARQRHHGWATCPTTIHGVVRILSNAAYPGLSLQPADVIANLRELCESPDHEFWPDSISILDEKVFDAKLIASAKHITDIVLLGLAVRHGANLVTFDTKIRATAVIGAPVDCIHVIRG